MLFDRPGLLEQGLPLSVLINLSERALATDAKDKIYGVMGLADANAREKITIDYYQSVADLYEEVTRHLIRDEKKLNILSNQSRDLQWIGGDLKMGDDVKKVTPEDHILYALTWGKRQKSSWTRDFSHAHSLWQPGPLLQDWYTRRTLYDACHGTQPLLDLEQRAGELGICGIQLDVVTESAKAWHLVPGMMQRFFAWEHILPVFFGAAQSTEGEDEHGREEAKGNEDKGKLEKNEVKSNKDILSRYDWDALYQPKGGPVKKIKEAIWRTVIGDKFDLGRPSAPAFCEKLFTALMQSHFSTSTAHLEITDEEASSPEEALELFHKFQRRVDHMLFRRSAFRTVNGWIGLAPDHVKEGDVVVLLSGGDVPFVLRRVDDERFVLVGECYVEGVMYGEAIDRQVKDKSIPGKLFRII